MDRILVKKCVLTEKKVVETGAIKKIHSNIYGDVGQ
jgi:hypothetical protein